MFYSSKYMFGDTNSPSNLPRPGISWLASGRGFYYVTLAFAVVATILVVALTQSRLGRLLRGMSQSPLALTTNGATIGITRVLIFALSAFLAAIAGALNGMVVGSVTQSSYPPLESLTVFAIIVIVVGDAPWYALMAAVGFVLIPAYWPSNTITLWLQLLFGVLRDSDGRNSGPLGRSSRTIASFYRSNIRSSPKDPR